MTNQRTIKDPVEIEGVGLQTGAKIRMRLEPSSVNSGINFVRMDLPDKPLLKLSSLALAETDLKERRTTVGSGSIEVQTTEHFMAALFALGIDNITVEVDNIELPGLDGSALGFITFLSKAGIKEYDTPKKMLKVKEPVFISDKDAFIAAFPDKGFKVSFTLAYGNPSIGTQYCNISIEEKNFEKEIAPARTFCLEEEALALLKAGLGKGANYENTLVMGKAGPINNTLRFPDEPVRHKILDLVGDLYLLGMPPVGRFIAVKSGHSLNRQLLKKLASGAV